MLSVTNISRLPKRFVISPVEPNNSCLSIHFTFFLRLKLSTPRASHHTTDHQFTDQISSFTTTSFVGHCANLTNQRTPSMLVGRGTHVFFVVGIRVVLVWVWPTAAPSVCLLFSESPIVSPLRANCLLPRANMQISGLLAPLPEHHRLLPQLQHCCRVWRWIQDF